MREFGAGGLFGEMRQCYPAGVESESELDPNSLTKVGARVLKN